MLAQFLARARAFLGRKQLEADLSAELQDHLEREIARNLGRGLPHDEARRAAHLAIGNLTIHAALVVGTDVLDPRLFSTAAAVMIVTAGVAAWLPARRVLRVDPVDALRAD